MIAVGQIKYACQPLTTVMRSAGSNSSSFSSRSRASGFASGYCVCTHVYVRACVRVWCAFVHGNFSTRACVVFYVTPGTPNKRTSSARSIGSRSGNWRKYAMAFSCLVYIVRVWRVCVCVCVRSINTTMMHEHVVILCTASALTPHTPNVCYGMF